MSHGKRKERVKHIRENLTEISRRWLTLSLTDCHEYYLLELLRAWEPLHSSRTLLDGNAKVTQNGFLDGNQVASTPV